MVAVSTFDLLSNSRHLRHTSKAKERGLQHKEFEIRQAEKKALEDEMHNYRDASEKQITELLGEYQRTKDEMSEWVVVVTAETAC